jgi:biopolymer transport protein TolR
MMMTPKGSKRSLNFDLNLIPMIDVFSACICFLLMTVVWVNIGIVQVNQGVGAKTDANPASLVAQMKLDGGLTLSFRNLKRAPRAIEIGSQGRSTNLNELRATISNLAKSSPELKTVLVMPAAKTNYQEILNVMDEFRRQGLKEIGITPL